MRQVLQLITFKRDIFNITISKSIPSYVSNLVPCKFDKSQVWVVRKKISTNAFKAEISKIDNNVCENRETVSQPGAFVVLCADMVHVRPIQDLAVLFWSLLFRAVPSAQRENKRRSRASNGQRYPLPCCTKISTIEERVLLTITGPGTGETWGLKGS